MNATLDVTDLDAMEPGTIFCRGEVENSPLGYYATNSRRGDLLRWVAVRGGISDWAIYAYWNDWDWEAIRSSGDKVRADDVIRRLVPCTDEAFARYRG